MMEMLTAYPYRRFNSAYGIYMSDEHCSAFTADNFPGKWIMGICFANVEVLFLRPVFQRILNRIKHIPADNGFMVFLRIELISLTVVPATLQ